MKTTARNHAASKRTILVASSALVVTALLSGCSVLPPIDLSGLATQSAAPQTPIPGDRNSDGRLSDFEKQVLAQQAVRAYAMPDGAIVQVDPTQPLPAEIVDSITATAAPVVARHTSTAHPNVRGEVQDQLASLIAEQTEATGRGIVLFHHTWTVDLNDQFGPLILWWVGDFPEENWPIKATADREANLASVREAAERRNYEVIVVD